MKEPTVGRIVWYRVAGDMDGDIAVRGDQPRAAIITFVISPGLVNLAVFRSDGSAGRKRAVPFVQTGEPPPPGGDYCEWPERGANG